MAFNFDCFEYPAFVVVYGPSKHSITMYNRSEYDEQFACDVCNDADSARKLIEGYPGRVADMTIYVVPCPQKVHQALFGGQLTTEYEVESV